MWLVLIADRCLDGMIAKVHEPILTPNWEKGTEGGAENPHPSGRPVAEVRPVCGASSEDAMVAREIDHCPLVRGTGGYFGIRSRRIDRGRAFNGTILGW